MFTEKTFTIPPLIGISEKNIEEHLKLYGGYVKSANHILKQLTALSEDEWGYEKRELQRRFAFEYGGIRNHELFFTQFEGGMQPLKEGVLKEKIVERWKSVEGCVAELTTLATTRGVGWAMLYWDSDAQTLLTQWVDEQHIGHLPGLTPLIALDMWEHAFVADYLPSGKKAYIEDFFANLNWSVIEQRFNTTKPL